MKRKPKTTYTGPALGLFAILAMKKRKSVAK